MVTYGKTRTKKGEEKIELKSLSALELRSSTNSKLKERKALMQYTTLPFEVKLPDGVLSFELNSLYNYLDRVIDQRHARGKLYAFAPLVSHRYPCQTMR